MLPSSGQQKGPQTASPVLGLVAEGEAPNARRVSEMCSRVLENI